MLFSVPALPKLSKVNITSPNIGYVDKNIMKFGSWDKAQKSSVFSFKPIDLSNSCRVSELQSKCTFDNNCNGFLFSAIITGKILDDATEKFNLPSSIILINSKSIY
jgi:hypothetical protein